MQVPKLSRKVTAGRRVSVDVVMPFYNHGAFVQEAINSIQDQSYAARRIIVVDDGSDDTYSKSVLADLESADVVDVLHQRNGGPSVARNSGIEASDADAVLFLDSDDMLTPGYLEAAIAALADAHPCVGFAYPDQQCFGTVDSLTVMPSYNLHLLSRENYCGTGCIVDGGVFALHHRFREDVRHGHEDWEFYLRLGIAGIWGVDFHEAPVLWRRWGYSRSDDVMARTGEYQAELRRLHPELVEDRRMVQIKREWSPALSIVLLGTTEAGAGKGGLREEQSCADYEVLTVTNGQLPLVRGRWVLLVNADQASGALLTDREGVERVVRIAADMAGPMALWLLEGDPGFARARWQRVDETCNSLPVALVVDGRTYDNCVQQDTVRAQTSVRAMMTWLARSSGGVEERRWIGRQTPRVVAVDGPVVELAGAPATISHGTPRGAHVDSGSQALAKRIARAQEREKHSRWWADPLLFGGDGIARPPQAPLGFGDGTEALLCGGWKTWVPSQTWALDLVVGEGGHAGLEVVYDWPTRAKRRSALAGMRFSLGRLWARKYLGAAALYVQADLETHRAKYRISTGPAAEREEPLGYLATEPFSDMVSLSEQLKRAAQEVATTGEDLVLPEIVMDIGEVGAYLEPDTRYAPRGRQTRRRGRRAAWLGGGGGLGATLYEVELPGGIYRYTTHPDAGAPLGSGIRSVAVAELGPIQIDSSRPRLEQIQYGEGGGVGYITGPSERGGAGEVGTPLALGSFAADAALGVPLVRLRPSGSAPGGLPEVGHRLAIDWEELAGQGYITEGVVGYVWRPDQEQAPLFCWDAESSSASRLLTLGEAPPEDGRDWRFRGTIGLAWQPRTRRRGLAELWEVRSGERIVYAVNPEEFEAVGFRRRRVVAQVATQRSPGSIPLWRTALHNDSPWLVTPCPGERAGEGYVRQGIVCFLDPAHPSGPEGHGNAGDLMARALSGDVADGPVPFGTPLYRIVDFPGRPPRVAAAIPERMDAIVEEVAGYLAPERTFGDVLGVPRTGRWRSRETPEEADEAMEDPERRGVDGSLRSAEAILRRAHGALPQPAQGATRFVYRTVKASLKVYRNNT